MLLFHHSTAKPAVSSTACLSLSCIFSLDGYDGKSSRLKQVCALGSESGDASATKCKVKSLGAAAPVDPWRALKPANGTLLEPVTNCNSLALISASNSSTISQNQLTIGASGVVCLRRVCRLQSTGSRSALPANRGWRSRGDNGRSSCGGIISERPRCKDSHCLSAPLVNL